MWDSGVAPETAFSTAIKKTRNCDISCGRKVAHTFHRVPDPCRIYLKVQMFGLWWPNTLLRHFVGVSFILAVSCPSFTHTHNLEWKMNVFIQQMSVPRIVFHQTESHRFVPIIKQNRTRSFLTKTYRSCIGSYASSCVSNHLQRERCTSLNNMM
jgi:hypothetical protein